MVFAMRANKPIFIFVLLNLINRSNRNRTHGKSSPNSDIDPYFRTFVLNY